jgi:hypothetical protein
MLVTIPPDTFAYHGRRMMNRHYALAERTEMRRFRALFGCSPLVCSRAWSKLKRFKLLPKGGAPSNLLWALLMMKLYDSEVVHSAIAGVDPKTFRKWSWEFIEALSNLDAKVVSTNQRM